MVRSAHLSIGKQLVDEVMRLLHSTVPSGCEVRICRCAMSAAIQKVIEEFKQNRPSGMARFVFLVNKEPITILVNVDHIIKNYRLSHVQA